MVIPFAGSIEWYRLWLAARLAGLDDNEACKKASFDLKSDDKQCHRTLIEGRDKPMLLSVPIKKGSSTVSDHGNWTRIHLGAINAQYGREPFFPFIFSEISEIYALAEAKINYGLNIECLNKQIHNYISQWIEPDDARMAILLAHKNDKRKQAFIDISNNISTNLNYNLSIFHLIFRYGKNSIFALIDPNDLQN